MWLGAALLAAPLPAWTQGPTSAALLQGLRAAVEQCIASLEAMPGGDGATRRALGRLREADRLLSRTGRDHAADALLLARALGPLAAAPAGLDAALEAARNSAIDALLNEGTFALQRAGDFADNVPTPAGRKRAARLADRGAAAFGVADTHRLRDDLAGCLRAAARGFRVCDRATRLSQKLGSSGHNADLCWLKSRLFASTCATTSCHSAAAAKGGLVLEGDRPFAELVGIPAANAAAAAAGKLRVRPGDPDGSFLYQKLAGTLGAGEGDSMPQVGIPLGGEALRRVVSWIAQGALPCGPEDITLPEPASGFQIRIPPFDVPVGSEVQRNYYFKAGIDQAAVATRIEFIYPPGSHHFNLFTSDTEDRPDGSFEDTFDAIPFQTWSLRASSQRQRLDWTLPPGVGILFAPHQQILGQIHFVNSGLQTSPLGGMAVVNVHTQPPEEIPVRLGTMFGQNKSIALPPHAESTWDFGTTFNAFGIQDRVKVSAVTGHFHWRGKSFEVRLWDGQNKDGNGFPQDGEFDRMGPQSTIYRSDDWNEPPFRIFPSGQEVEVPAGWGVVYRTIFYNPSDTFIFFGPHVETEEHANLFVYFYPGPPDGKTLAFPLPFQR